MFSNSEVNGGLIAWGDVTGGGCWSTTGIAEGFNGFASKSVGELGAPATWQLVSLSEECDGGSEA